MRRLLLFGGGRSPVHAPGERRKDPVQCPDLAERRRRAREKAAQPPVLALVREAGRGEGVGVAVRERDLLRLGRRLVVVEAQHGVVARALDAAYHATNAARSSDRRTIAREVMHANQQMAAAKAERAERDVKLALEEDRAMLRAEARGPF